MTSLSQPAWPVAEIWAVSTAPTRSAMISAPHSAAKASPLLRACASRRSWAAAWAALPAIVGPGAADQPATDDGGVGQRQPERHHQPAPLGAPAQLAVLVAPGVGALDHPPAAHLDRRRHPTDGDLAHHAPLGQHLPAGLVVVAGV